MNLPICENLKTLRQLHRLSQEQVAEHIGVTRQAVAKWESGETLPDLFNSTALAKLYQITLDSLVQYDAKELGLPIPPKGKHAFGVVTVGERGQIVIPKKARDLFDIQPGEELMVLGQEGEGLALIKHQEFIARIEMASKGGGLW